MPEQKIIIRSEEVQEVLGRIPPRILRYGMVVLGLFLFAILALSYFIKYPDLVEAPALIMSSPAPASILAKQAGQIGEVFAHSGDTVRRGQLLATLRSNANTEDIDHLKRTIAVAWDYRALLDTLEGKKLSLGEVQPQYNALLATLEAYRQCSAPAVLRAIDSQRERLASLKRLEQTQALLCRSLADEYAIAQRQHARDTLLLTQRVLSPEDYDRRERLYLQSLQQLVQQRMARQNIRLQIADAESALHLKSTSATQLVEEKKSAVVHALRILSETLWSWKERYSLHSPIEGVVNSANLWQPEQAVHPGELIYTIAPQHPARLHVQVQLPSQNLGKVRVGQEVFIVLPAYPEQEFGRLKGRVAYIASTPNADGVSLSSVTLPQGLQTTYGIQLPPAPHFTGTASIITQDKRLIERLLLPVKYQISKSTRTIVN